MMAGSAAAHQARQPVPAADCDGAPPDAVLVIPVPAAYWARIVCTDTGHTLAPIPGDAWQVHQDSRNFSVPAASAGTGATGRHGSYFVVISLLRLDQQHKRAALALFSKKVGSAPTEPIRDTAAVYLLGNYGSKTTVYVFLGDDGPIAGIACLDTCDKTVSVSVTHPEMEPLPQ
jgi:hypothetical protein